MRVVVLIFLSLLGGLTGSCQKKITLLFNIKLDTSNIIKMENLNIQLIFKNVGTTDLLVTRLFDYTYKEHVNRPKPVGDLIWEVEKFNQNKYIEQPITEISGNIPFYVPKEEQFDTLKPKKSIIKEYPLWDYYQLGVGSYRVRAKYVIPQGTGVPVKFLYSNWYKFYIKKPIRYFLE